MFGIGYTGSDGARVSLDPKMYAGTSSRQLDMTVNRQIRMLEGEVPTGRRTGRASHDIRTNIFPSVSDPPIEKYKRTRGGSLKDFHSSDVLFVHHHPKEQLPSICPPKFPDPAVVEGPPGYESRWAMDPRTGRMGMVLKRLGTSLNGDWLSEANTAKVIFKSEKARVGGIKHLQSHLGNQDGFLLGNTDADCSDVLKDPGNRQPPIDTPDGVFEEFRDPKWSTKRVIQVGRPIEIARTDHLDVRYTYELINY